ncbi:hypothetical protein ASPZODRAFT_56841 [Penicilliopsis zonata CBS 506.65]|uniref:Mannan endo-1,6-alpha-mannosidase n=1 Tax=Penicilliopsis zonata CBS 506.65 TaxID=1073090 RepID=A0A1L9SU66_9EURO|nr:hypothetical protein ASPZODRAFT_56841 [Penicilliopsis zonata CBS 506.65]OJJ50742.1 hypothetical protein ASPZODRAFT_56841 [Penicilliopsis zonata CBS 506.65]
MPSWRTILTAVLIGACSVGAIDLDLDDPNSIKAAAKIAATEMMSYYTGNHLGDTPGNLPTPYYWWEAGAMFGALVDYWFYTGDSTWNDITMQGMLWQAAPTADFMPANQTRTEGNDDQGFWAVAAMSAAERNFPNPPADQPQWLQLAQAVFNEQATRWDMETCGGGLRWQIFTWNNGYNYKNTISNGCFFNLAARLAKYTNNQTYADWAVKVWDWTTALGFMSPEYEFWDGADDTQNCTEFNRIQWTYNAGVYLLGAANMFNYTNGDPLWQNRTQSILDAAGVFFIDNPKDVMYERACETVNTCKVDQRSFKAYLSRWMAATTQMAPFTYDAVITKLRASAQAAAQACTGGSQGTSCGLKWTQGSWDGSLGVGEQMSAMEVFQANLIARVVPPVTNSTGGTSQGDPSAGSQPTPTQPRTVTRTITAGDRAAAGILTGLMMIAVVGSTGWMIWE